MTRFLTRRFQSSASLAAHQPSLFQRRYIKRRTQPCHFTATNWCCRMPKLLLFAACEKVLIDQHNNISLIGVLQDAQVAIPAQPTVPAGAKVRLPMKWDVVTLWAKTDERSYEQRVALFDPSGNPTGIDSTLDVEFRGKQGMRNVVTIFGLPVYEMGVYVLKLWLREKGQDFGDPLADYPISLSRQEPKSP